MGELRLEVADYRDERHWRWRLREDGAIRADHATPRAGNAGQDEIGVGHGRGSSAAGLQVGGEEMHPRAVTVGRGDRQRPSLRRRDQGPPPQASSQWIMYDGPPT